MCAARSRVSASLDERSLTATDIEHFFDAVDGRLDGSPIAVMLDVDGTLAPIAPRPQDALVPARTREALRRLETLPGVTLALVSGRSAQDAWDVAGVSGAWVIGNHGLELRAPTGEVSTPVDVHAHESAIAAAADRLTSATQDVPGAIVENKRWTLSLHYRLAAPNEHASLIDRAREIADALGLRVTEGKKLVELRPPVDVNKGTATVALAQRVGALRDGGSALYAGDDRTDEDAFDALRARSREAVTIRIATNDRDARPIETHAEFVLASPDELRRALEWMVARRTRAATS